MNKTAHFWGWVLLFVCFVWGVEFSLVHMSLDSMGAHTFNGIRFLIAFITLAAWFIYSKHGFWRRLDKWLVIHGVVLGFLLFTGFATQTIGLQYTTASNAGFITGLNVVMVPIIAWLWLRQTQHWYVWLGVALATIGTLLLTGGLSGFGEGELWVLICALGFATHIVYISRFAQTIDALSLTQVQMITVTVLSFLSAFWWEAESLAGVTQVLLSEGSFVPWVALILGGTLGTAFAYLAQTLGQQSLEAWRVALIYSTEPLFAALGGFVLLDERLAMLAWIGALFIIAGMLIAELVDDDVVEELLDEPNADVK
ncbi:DMT family transporter [Bermanella marisrubri]|uniref:Membrane protein n=1 Tax=Bermanella marisrubri TaxID=207949 RepID=Q1N3F1_9GAMM|nr:DMT family transporter [Bermanella marisrubri]EAT12640.1 membrane protein [Oceanobacter sp. RED65] [Bermanella marisrubri]QIZ85869.1 DMT family transporter [Bermanella marisrubri]